MTCGILNVSTQQFPKPNTDSHGGNQQKDKRPTLKTIAAMAEVGTSTVPKALRDAPDVGKKTKERIKLIAEEIE